MKRTIAGLIHGCKLHFALVTALACFLGGQVATAAKSTPFSRIVVFGDSLSDTGNFFHLTGGLAPPAPYAKGRFSNGPLWVEYLAEGLGMQLRPGDNYAVAGATTGHGNSNDGFLGLEYPDLQDQVLEYLASHQASGADPDALYVVWAGANDFFAVLETGGSPAALMGGGVSSTVQTIQLLWRAGARHILVANVPDLGVTPFGLGSGMSPVITELCAAYNQALAAALQTLAKAGVPTIRVDAFATLREMADFPAKFGFANVTEPFLSAGGNPAQFLFWDPVHPTTRAHEVLADEALDRLIDYFSPRNGKGTPLARVNALKGLVRAKKGK